MLVSEIKVLKVVPCGRKDWFEASGVDPEAPDSSNTGYWTVGPTREAAIEELRSCLEKMRIKRREASVPSKA